MYSLPITSLHVLSDFLIGPHYKAPLRASSRFKVEVTFSSFVTKSAEGSKIEAHKQAHFSWCWFYGERHATQLGVRFFKATASRIYENYSLCFAKCIHSLPPLKKAPGEHFDHRHLEGRARVQKSEPVNTYISREQKCQWKTEASGARRLKATAFRSWIRSSLLSSISTFSLCHMGCYSIWILQTVAMRHFVVVHDLLCYCQ